MAWRNRKMNTTTAATRKCKFTALKPGLKDVHFTHKNSRAAGEFGIVGRKITRHIGRKDKGTMESKAMEEMAHPIISKPVEPIQEY